MRLHVFATAVLLLACFAAPSLADDTADIRARIENWARDLNEGRPETACDLFSRELVSDTQGWGEADYQTQCARISEALQTQEYKFHFSPDIKEIVVEDNLAMVRLQWTVSVSPGNDTSNEWAFNVFRKEADGVWRIFRLVAFRNEEARSQP